MRLYSTSSLEEMNEKQHDMLRQITDCLDSISEGYRFVENDEDYNKVMKRFERYNIIYCMAISRFNPELSPNKGNQDKVVRILALMKKMEDSALTKPNGYEPSEKQSELTTVENNIYPTQTEIESINERLPVEVGEGILNTKVEYDDQTKIQTFYYRYTQEVDEKLITKSILQNLKSNMVSALKDDENNIKRLKAGMTFQYVYYSIDNKRLYQ